MGQYSTLGKHKPRDFPTQRFRNISLRKELLSWDLKKQVLAKGKVSQVGRGKVAWRKGHGETTREEWGQRLEGEMESREGLWLGLLFFCFCFWSFCCCCLSFDIMFNDFLIVVDIFILQDRRGFTRWERKWIRAKDKQLWVCVKGNRKSYRLARKVSGSC